MKKSQVLLVCLLPLLCEGLQRVLAALNDVDVVCLPGADALGRDLQAFQADMVLVAGEDENDASTHLISDLLKRFVDVPIVWIGLETNVLRLYTSHLLPASSGGLIEAIRQRKPHPAESTAHAPASSGGTHYAS